MKKLVFLITPVVALVLVGCAGAGSSSLTSSPFGYALTNTRTPQTLDGQDTRGVRLFLSPRSAVNIDVECILEYVQGDVGFHPEYRREDYLHPWIHFEYAY